MQSVTSGPTQRGFTLIELMVTLAVMVVLMAVAVPSMTDFAANNRVAATKSAFASTVALARTEAARSGLQVFIKAGTGGVAGNEFAGGWAVYADTNGSGAPDSGDEVLRSFAALPSDIRLEGISPLGFLPTGYLVGGNTMDYTVCRSVTGSAGFKVSVVPSGIADSFAYTNC